MKPGLSIASLYINFVVERPAKGRRGGRQADPVQIELHDESLQAWSDLLFGGEHFHFDSERESHRMFEYIGSFPDLDALHRCLAEHFAAHRNDMIGAYLAGPIEAVEKAIAARDGSSVYFADAGGQIKIGWSKKVSQRLAQLQTGSASPIKLLGTMPGGLAVERRVHAKFAHLRLSGEWFTAAPELLAYVDEVATR